MSRQSSNIKHQSSDKAQNSKFKQGTQKAFDLEERMTTFGERVIDFCRTVKLDTINRSMIDQFLRSATSVGANYCEANNGSSRRDFKNKANIAKKEAQETKYWARLIKKSNPEHADALDNLAQEAHELLLILQSIITKVGKP